MERFTSGRSAGIAVWRTGATPVCAEAMVDESRITQWQAALTRGIATRRATLARLIGVPLGLSLFQVSQLEGDAKGKKGKKKKKKGKGKNKGGGTSPPPPPTSPPPPGGGNGAPLDSEESAFLTQINAYRAQNGRGALTANSQLNAAADAHSSDMANNNYFSHTSLSGTEPDDRAAAAGYPVPNTVGENISAGRESADENFQAWKASVEHNKNMLDATYTEIGIGRAFKAGSQYGWYWTNVFGKG